MNKYEKLLDLILFESASINSFIKACTNFNKSKNKELSDFEKGFFEGMKAIRNDLLEIIEEEKYGKDNVSDKSNKLSDRHLS